MRDSKVLKCAPTLLPDLPRFLPYGSCFPLGTFLFLSLSFSVSYLCTSTGCPLYRHAGRSFRGLLGYYTLGGAAYPLRTWLINPEKETMESLNVHRSKNLKARGGARMMASDPEPAVLEDHHFVLLNTPKR